MDRQRLGLEENNRLDRREVAPNSADATDNWKDWLRIRTEVSLGVAELGLELE